MRVFGQLTGGTPSMSQICGRKDPFFKAWVKSIAGGSQSLHVRLLIGFVEGLEVQRVLKFSDTPHVLPTLLILAEQCRIGIHLIVKIGTHDRFLQMRIYNTLCWGEFQIRLSLMFWAPPRWPLEKSELRLFIAGPQHWSITGIFFLGKGLFLEPLPLIYRF